MYRPGGQRIDINGDGIPDVRVGPYGNTRPDVGMNYMGAPGYPPAYPHAAYPPHYGGGVRLDVNGDGIPDVKFWPYGQVRPDVGSYAHGPYQQPYYGPHY